MSKILTIVIPTYNMQDYLHRCLGSLIVSPERLELLEVLVVIDGSKDNSSAIAHEYEVKYPNTFRVIDKENGNYGSCVNRGLAEAKGKYIKVLDADDWFDTKNFEAFLLFLKDSDADLVVSDFDRVDESGKVIDRFVYGLDTKNNDSLEVIPRNKLFMMHAVAYKTDNVRSIGYHQTEGISYTDQEWIFLPMATVDKVAYFDQVVYKYLVGREGQTMDPAVFIKHFDQEMQGLETMMRQFEEFGKSVNKEQYDYLVWRLKARMDLVYCKFLINSYKTMDIKRLVDFDTNMKTQYPASYQISNGMYVSKRIPYRFIRAFRRFHTKYYPSIILYRWYSSLRK